MSGRDYRVIVLQIEGCPRQEEKPGDDGADEAGGGRLDGFRPPPELHQEDRRQHDRHVIDGHLGDERDAGSQPGNDPPPPVEPAAQQPEGHQDADAAD